MADQGIKKIIISKKTLPPVNESNQHFFRYRVISEDKNRISHWSPIYNLSYTALVTVAGAVSVSGSIISIVWGDEALRPNYDIFVKFDSGEYFYHGTSSTHNYSIINQGVSTVRVAIQVEGREKIRASGLTIYESGIVSVV